MSNTVLPSGMCRSDRWAENELYDLGMRLELLADYLYAGSVNFGSASDLAFYKDMVLKLRRISADISDVRADFVHFHSRFEDCNATK